MSNEDTELAEYYRQTAAILRSTAESLRLDVRRHDQLLALAEGFRRAAERLEKSLTSS